MNFLILDHESMGLDLALRAQQAGHSVILANGYDGDKTPARSGDGLVQKTLSWQSKMKWADLILMTGNGKWMEEIDGYHKRGYPIFGPNKLAADLELDRCYGQQVLSSCGVETLPFTNFEDYEEAERFVLKTLKRYVSKPHGDKKKDLSYVSKNPADMVYMLRRWAKNRPAQEGFFLQEFQAGIEMAVGGWFGPSGWVGPFCESFECKKLMPGDLGVNCYSEDTEVLTKDGWKFWPEVVIEDEICTLKDGIITYEKPSRITVGESDKELIGWKSPYVDVLVTPGHQMYVQDDHQRKDFWFESANITETNSRCIHRGSGEWLGEDDVSQLPAFYKGGFSEWCALLGAFIADGSTRPRSVVFGNCPPHKQDTFIGVAKAAGYTAKMYGLDLYINSTELSEHFQNFGKACDKFVPAYVKNGSKHAISKFLQAYGKGDGTSRKNNLCFTTVSKRLADDLQELCLKVGWCANVRIRDRRGESHLINGYLCINQQIAYEVRVSQDKLKANLTPQMTYRQEYSGKVYCCTVSSHIIYVRRNGSACFLGQTGEMGTPVKYVRESQLAERVLKPCESVLHALNYVGYVDVNCIIDKRGCAWPLEWTARLGWPLTHAQVALHMGDPINWMADLLEGKDSLSVSYNHCVCVVVAIPDFPFSKLTSKEVEGVPIYGITKENRDAIHPCNLMKGNAPAMKGDRVVDTDLFVTSDDYPLVVSGTGSTVSKAKRAAYETIDELEIPNSPLWRNDISDRLEKELPELQKHGIATGWRWE